MCLMLVIQQISERLQEEAFSWVESHLRIVVLVHFKQFIKQMLVIFDINKW